MGFKDTEWIGPNVPSIGWNIPLNGNNTAFARNNVIVNDNFIAITKLLESHLISFFLREQVCFHREVDLTKLQSLQAEETIRDKGGIIANSGEGQGRHGIQWIHCICINLHTWAICCRACSQSSIWLCHQCIGSCISDWNWKSNWWLSANIPFSC